MTQTLTKKYTIEEFENLPEAEDGTRYELVDGELVELSSTSEKHARICNRIQYYLTQHVLPNNLGEVYAPGARYAVVPGKNSVRVPDASFVQASRVTRDVITMRFAPDIAVEVLSGSNDVIDIEKKAKEYRAAGGQLVWVVNPEDQEVYVYRAGELQRQTLTAQDNLDGAPVLPGFKLLINKLFE